MYMQSALVFIHVINVNVAILLLRVMPGTRIILCNIFICAIIRIQHIIIIVGSYEPEAAGHTHVHNLMYGDFCTFY